MLKRKETRFNIDLDYLRELDDDSALAAKYIIDNPLKSIVFLERTLEDVINNLDFDGISKKQGMFKNVT